MSDDFIVRVCSELWKVYSTKDANHIATLSKERFKFQTKIPINITKGENNEALGILDKKTRRIYPATL
jgi:hypothetical protein